MKMRDALYIQRTGDSAQAQGGNRFASYGRGPRFAASREDIRLLTGADNLRGRSLSELFIG